MATSVTLTSRTPVFAASPQPLPQPFRLGPFDQTAGFVPIQVVWVYQHQPGVHLIPEDRLKRAIELLLDYYPYLTGRIHVDPSSGVREILAIGTGAELALAQCSQPLDAFLSPQTPSPGRIMSLPGAGNALLAPFDPDPSAASSQPILAVQHTRFTCGSVALGVRNAHTVCDGDGFFQVVRDLVELYRGVLSCSPSLSNPPHIVPYMAELIGADLSPVERQTALSYKPKLFLAESTKDNSFTNFTPPPYPVVGRFLRYSAHELLTLKARATDPAGDSWVSTFSALAAHLHQRVYRARLKLHAANPALGALSPPDFLTPVNLRTRLSFSQRYSPNALFTAYTNPNPSEAEALSTAPLWQTAKIIHDLTRPPAFPSPGELTQTLRWIALQPDMRTIKTGFRYGSGSLMVSAWNKFDMGGTNFAFEALPVLVSPPFTQSSLVDGLVYLLPPEQDGGVGDIDVCMALSEPVWALFDADKHTV